MKTTDDLLPGDVLFFMDASNIPQHIAIYNGKRADTHFITHAVAEPYFSVMTTRLKADDFPYRVFRPKDFSLGAQTAVRMRIWAEHQVPYSLEKIAQIHDKITDMAGMDHPKTGGEAQLALAQKYFAPNFYRYIEFAAHPSMPYFPHAHLPLRGLYCSEAITAAFNIETLLKIEAVKSCEQLGASWVSDNTNSASIRRASAKLAPTFKPPQAYIDYLKNSKSPKEYPFLELTLNKPAPLEPFPPSFAAWDYDKYKTIENFVKTFNFTLPLDAKITTPWAIMSYFLKHPSHWKDCGELVVADIKYPLALIEKDKQAWQQYVDALFKVAKLKQEAIRSRCISPIDALLGSKQPIKPQARKFSVDDLEMLLAPAKEPDNIAQLTQYKRAVLFATPPKDKSKKKPCVKSKKLPAKRKLKLDAHEEKKSFDKEDDAPPSPTTKQFSKLKLD